MDTKKMIEKLVKITESHQKIINKLAQQLPPPNELKPARTQKDAAQVVFNALQENVKDYIDYMYTRSGDMFIKFKQGKKSQAVYNVVFSTLKKLTDENKIQQAYALKIAE
jgi:hypothetical protein